MTVNDSGLDIQDPPAIQSALQYLASIGLLPGLNSQSLLEQIRVDLEHAALISQGRKRTCAAASCQMLLALIDPERYIELVGSLARPDAPWPKNLIGFASKPSVFRDDGSGRSLTSQLLQPALMQIAKQAPGLLAWSRGRSYDPAADCHSSPLRHFFPAWTRGLLQNETTYLLNQLFGPQSYRTVIVASHPGYWLYPDEGRVMTRRRALALLNETLAAGHPVPSGLRWDGAIKGHHQILVTRIDAEAAQVYGLNPWGEAQILTLADFRRRLATASIPMTGHRSLPGTGDALARLPGKAGDPAGYAALPWYRIQHPVEYLAGNEPMLQSLSLKQRKRLARCFRRYRLKASALHRLLQNVPVGSELERWLRRLEQAGNQARALELLAARPEGEFSVG